MNEKTAARDVIISLIGAGIFSWLIILFSTLPPEASRIFDGTVWFSLISMIFATATLGLVYFGRIAISRHSRALISLLLIGFCISTFSLIRITEENIAFWAPLFHGKAANAATLLQLLVGYGGNFLTLVVAAVAANLLASSFPQTPS